MSTENKVVVMQAGRKNERIASSQITLWRPQGKRRNSKKRKKPNREDNLHSSSNRKSQFHVGVVGGLGVLLSLKLSLPLSIPISLSTPTPLKKTFRHTSLLSLPTTSARFSNTSQTRNVIRPPVATVIWSPCHVRGTGMLTCALGRTRSVKVGEERIEGGLEVLDFVVVVVVVV